jgi:hypothetical protein
MNGFKTFKCVVCGAEVTKPKSFAVEGGRACRCHTEEIQANKEAVANEKCELIAGIIENALPQVMRKIERNMRSFINDNFASMTYAGSYDQKQHERDYDITLAFHWHEAMDKAKVDGRQIDVKFDEIRFRSAAFQDRLKRETDAAKKRILHDPAFAIVHADLMDKVGKTKENAEALLGKKNVGIDLGTRSNTMFLQMIVRRIWDSYEDASAKDIFDAFIEYHPNKHIKAILSDDQQLYDELLGYIAEEGRLTSADILRNALAVRTAFNHMR